MQPEKIVFTRMNSDVPLADMEPGEYLPDSFNLIPAKGAGATVRRENIKDTSKVANSFLPAGANKNVGAFYDHNAGQVVYFNYNYHGNHGIYLYNSANGVTELIQSVHLAFLENTFINGVAMYNNQLHWQEKNKPLAYLDLEKSKQGAYVGITSRKAISLHRISPRDPPFATSQFDVARNYNFIADQNFQFANRFIYYDGSVTKFSPLSNLIEARKVPDLTSNSQHNRVRVTIAVDIELYPFIDRIQFAYRKNNSGQYYLFDDQKSDGVSATYTSLFYNNEIGTLLPESESNIHSENIPDLGGALELFEDRLFTTRKTIGHKNDSDTQLTITQDTQAFPLGSTYFKDGGIYRVGLFCYDEVGVQSAIIADEEFRISYKGAASATSIKLNDRKRIQIDITGQPPLWAKYYMVGITKNQFHQVYVQCPVNILYYSIEYPGEGYDPNPTGVVIDGKVFWDHKPNASEVIVGGVRFVYLQIPENFPLVLDTSYYVRFLWTVGITPLTRQIIDIIGDFVVLDAFDLTSYEAVPDNTIVEFFRRKESQDEFFYEIGIKKAISNPCTDTRAYSTPQIIIVGDTYVINGQKADNSAYRFRALEPLDGDGSAAGGDLPDYNIFKETEYFIESPTPVFSPIQIEVTEDVSLFGAFKVLVNFSKKGNVLDYTKIAWDIGRIGIKNEKAKEESQPNIIVFSDRRVQSSLVNGLANWQTLSLEGIAADRSNIVKLIRANNVMLAIHERNITSIYVGEGFVRAGSDAFLTKTEGVIGDDRVMIKELGSVNPESVVEYRGRVYGFDLYEGEPWRYSRDGITDLATTYNMRTFFKNLADKRLPYIDQAVIVGGYHPFWNVYLLTFRAINTITVDATVINELIVSGTFFYSKAIELSAAKRYRAIFEFQAGVDPGSRIVLRYAGSIVFDIVVFENEVSQEFAGITGAFDTILSVDVPQNPGGVTFKLEELSVVELHPAVTIGFSEKLQGWIHQFSFSPERYERLNNELISWKGGELYRHDVGPGYNKFHDDEVPNISSITVPFQVNEEFEKFIESLGLASNDSWLAFITTPNGQSTSMIKTDYHEKNHIFYVEVLRDENTIPELIPKGSTALVGGEELSDRLFEIKITNDNDTFLYIDGIYVGFMIQPGHFVSS